MDSQQLQQATSNPNIQRVLQKQTSLSKRLSAAGGGGLASSSSHDPHHHQQQAAAAASAAALAAQQAASTRIKIPETSYSHTETAVWDSESDGASAAAAYNYYKQITTRKDE